MIYFNGKPLESVAPVKIEDIRVSPIGMSILARQRPIQYGSDFVRISGGSRTVSITFGLPTNDITSRQRQLREITGWAVSSTPQKLFLPYRDNCYLECICTALPEPSTRQWWEAKLSLTFQTVENPYWTSTEEHTAECGTAIYVGGNAPPLMQITNTFASAASNQAYSDGTDTMTFTTIPAGEMTLDLNAQTAAVGSTSIMQYYTFNSVFLEPKAGQQTITGAGTVHWRERWQ